MPRSEPATIVVGLMSAVILAACTGEPSGPSPIISLDARICATTIDLAGAHAVPLESTGDGGTSSGKGVTVQLDADAACLRPANGEKRLYAVFKLPDSPAPYIITIASEPVVVQ